MHHFTCETILWEANNCVHDEAGDPPCVKKIENICNVLVPPKNDIIFDFNMRDLERSDDGGVTYHVVGSPRFHTGAFHVKSHFTFPPVAVLREAWRRWPKPEDVE